MTAGPGRAVPQPCDEDAVAYCRTCRRALNIHMDESGRVSLRHSEQLRGGTVDHPADPVPVTELADPLIECDFCSRPEAAFSYVCRDQVTESRVVTTRTVDARDYHRRHHAARTRSVTTAPAATQIWGQRWAACDGCAELIERRDLYGLVGRGADAMPAKYTRGNCLARVRGELHATYSNVFATLQPGRGRITPEHPLGVWEPTVAASPADPLADPEADTVNNVASGQRRP
jgi:hypothetical protein